MVQAGIELTVVAEYGLNSSAPAFQGLSSRLVPHVQLFLSFLSLPPVPAELTREPPTSSLPTVIWLLLSLKNKVLVSKIAFVHLWTEAMGTMGCLSLPWQTSLDPFFSLQSGMAVIWASVSMPATTL